MKELKYISTDVEYSWESKEKLGQWSLLSLWSCEVWDINNSFYAELKPITDIYSEEAINVIKGWFKWIWDNPENFSPQEVLLKLGKYWLKPDEAFWNYKEWLKLKKWYDLKELAAPVKFDWWLTAFYFREYVWSNPLWYRWEDSNSMLRWFLSDPHVSFGRFGLDILEQELPHNALQDAQIQWVWAEFLLKLMDDNKQSHWELLKTYYEWGYKMFIKSPEVTQYIEWLEDTVSTIHNTPFWQEINYKTILS